MKKFVFTALFAILTMGLSSLSTPCQAQQFKSQEGSADIPGSRHKRLVRALICLIKVWT